MTDAEYEKIASRFSDDGVYGTPLDTAVVTAGSGLTVNVRSGVYGSVRGHAWWSGTSTTTLTIAANAAGSTRTDRVVLRLDRSDWTVRAMVRQGTAGGGAPSLVQSTGDAGLYEILLANVTVLAGASAVTVARGERYVGTRVRPCTSASLANPSPTLGELRYETDTKRLRLYDGEALRNIYDYAQVSADSPLSAWTITVESSIESRAGTVCLRLGTWDRKGSTLPAATDARLPVLIPADYRHPDRNQYATAYITGAEIGRITIYPANHDRAGQVWLTQKPSISVGDSVLPQSVSWVVR
ncbi:hypothetical protein [Streptomyces sp. NPDC058254]|uniref:hypothetical protein n=1 Tax=Streptomyces sp. NPDC058254 TaxID=3346406 RepID=UPI0036E74772